MPDLSEKKMDPGFALLSLLLIIPFSFTVLPYLDGLVIQSLWRWFVSPKFGLQELTICDAIGLNLVWTAFAFRVRDIPSTKNSNPWVPFLKNLTQHLVFWGGIYLFGHFVYELGGGA